MEKLLLVTDFDGVFNFDASRNQYSKNPNSLSRLEKATAYCAGAGFNITWSAEAVFRINSLKNKFDFEWLWLSTWLSCTDYLAVDIRAKSDGYIPWSLSHSKSDDTYYKENFANKYSALKNVAKSRPLVWLEDEATVLYRPGDFNYSNLVITPDPAFGLDKNHMNAIEEYIKNTASPK